MRINLINKKSKYQNVTLDTNQPVTMTAIMTHPIFFSLFGKEKTRIEYTNSNNLVFIFISEI